MLLDKFGVDPKYVVALSNDNKNYIRLTSKGNNSEEQTNEKKNETKKNDLMTIQVTLIDANHCPGAYMFLLEGYFGTILHTGDFRYHERMMDQLGAYCGKIDDLYLDDTFCEDGYDFPSRKIAGNQILEIIQKYDDSYRICIATDTLGKEELLVAAAFKLKSLVVVSEERMKQIEVMRHVIDIPDIFTSNPDEGRIYCLSKRQVNYRTIMAMARQRPTIGILPSGWSTSNTTNIQDTDPLKTTVWRVPYSLHSSYPELKEFVERIRPKRIFSASIHDSISLRQKMATLMSDEEREPIEIPLLIQRSMKHQQKLHKPRMVSKNVKLTTKRNKMKKTTTPLTLIKKTKRKLLGATIPLPEATDYFDVDANTYIETDDNSVMMPPLSLTQQEYPLQLQNEDNPLMKALLSFSTTQTSLTSNPIDVDNHTIDFHPLKEHIEMIDSDDDDDIIDVSDSEVEELCNTPQTTKLCKQTPMAIDISRLRKASMVFIDSDDDDSDDDAE
eukprot:CAMPEP_0117425182 /NCGR_PEP_ID=MMETSP0758-20121206/5492_1 /TAXON_ID=63605 /ORGANISM="Percolomonas cosmopolitus, Strain AE-1 (ATCC 50343)" /LENGTH=499 /DNA_ID=CAMNT_0005209487 /DNA_START=136 /DNA_END=1632 /DNA_ORIENTATION=-